MNMRAIIVVLLFMAGLGTGAATAQENHATVIEAAPIYLTPDATRTPLRTAAVHTDLRVLAEEGDWLRVEFRDPQFGPRVGYVERRKVRVYRTEPRPADLSGRERASDPSTPHPSPARPPQSPAQGPGMKAYATYGSTAFAAADTLQAVAGSSTHTNIGGGATMTRLWRGVFVDVGLSRARVDGQRVFVDGGTVYELGIPLRMTVRPIDLAAGWQLTRGRLSPFIGGGFTSVLYEETGAFADEGDDVRERRSGPLVLAGLDATISRWVHIGAEVRYRAVRGILGDQGVSQAFGESQAGGMSAGLRVSVGR